MNAALKPVVSGNVVHMTDWTKRAPLVPEECDLRGMGGMMLDTLRLTRSGLKAHASGDEFRAAVLLWCESWLQVPSASLPDNDVDLAALAGVSATRWKRLKGGAMRGWVKCSNGRLYHPVVAEVALEAWSKRKTGRENANKRWQAARLDHGETGGNPAKTAENPEFSGKNPSKKSTETSNTKDLENATALLGKGREEKGISSEPTDVGSGAAGDGATAKPPVVTNRKGEALDLSNPEVRARHQLWTEGRAILEKIDPALPLPDISDLMGRMVSVYGKAHGKEAGLPRAVQVLRDMEVDWLAGHLGAGVKSYLNKIIHNVAGTSKEAKAAAKTKAESAAVTLAKDIGAFGYGRAGAPQDAKVIDGECAPAEPADPLADFLVKG